MRQFYVWALILLSSASIIGSCARKRSGSKIKSGGGNDFDSTINFKKVDWIDQAGKANAVLISETFDNLDDPSDLTGHTGFSFGDLHFGDLELPLWVVGQILFWSVQQCPHSQSACL